MKQRNKRSCTITVSLYALYVYLLFHRENIFMNLMKMNFLEILKEREKIKIAKIDDIYFFFSKIKTNFRSKFSDCSVLTIKI